MKTEALKINVAQRILSMSDEGLLQKIKNLLDKENVFAYDLEGNPITENDYIQNLDAINKEITSLNPDVIMLQEVDGRVPSCRLLNEPYDYDNKDNFQHYLIDGYIVSSNIEVESVKTLNLKFKNADHNPVLLKLKLKLVMGQIKKEAKNHMEHH